MAIYLCWASADTFLFLCEKVPCFIFNSKPEPHLLFLLHNHERQGCLKIYGSEKVKGQFGSIGWCWQSINAMGLKLP